MTTREAIQHGKEQLDVFGGTHREFIEMAIEALQERKTGKWIPAATIKGWHCSECVKDDPKTGKWIEVFDYRYPYCPNCGAKMEVDE